MADDDDEFTMKVGAREIYDAVQATRHEVSELRRDRDEDARDRARLWIAVRDLQKLKWQVRGAFVAAGGAVAAASALAAWLGH